MRTSLIIVGILALTLGLAACNKGGDNNGPAQTPANQNPGINPQTGLPWNNGNGQGGPGLQSYNVPHIMGGRIVNRAFFVQPMQSRPFIEEVKESCKIRRLSDEPRIERSRQVFIHNVYDLNLNFDGQGNLNIIMITPIGPMRNDPSRPVRYKLHRYDQSIEIENFRLEGMPNGYYAGIQQKYLEHLAELRNRELRNYDRRDRRSRDSGGYYYENDSGTIFLGVNWDLGSFWNDGLDGGYGGNYGNNDLSQGGFNPDYQPGQNPNPGLPPNPYFDNFSGGGPGGGQGSLVALFRSIKGRIFVARNVNPQHITHIEIGAPRWKYGSTPPAAYRVSAQVTLPNLGTCGSEFRVPRADFTLQ